MFACVGFGKNKPNRVVGRKLEENRRRGCRLMLSCATLGVCSCSVRSAPAWRRASSHAGPLALAFYVSHRLSIKISRCNRTIGALRTSLPVAHGLDRGDGAVPRVTSATTAGVECYGHAPMLHNIVQWSQDDSLHMQILHTKDRRAASGSQHMKAARPGSPQGASD